MLFRSDRDAERANVHSASDDNRSGQRRTKATSCDVHRTVHGGRKASGRYHGSGDCGCADHSRDNAARSVSSTARPVRG